METKTCTLCKEIKDLNLFRYVPSRKVYNAQCHTCELEARRKRHADNPQKANNQQKAWREANPEKVKVAKKKDGAKRRERAKTAIPDEGFKYCQSCSVQKPLIDFTNGDNTEYKCCVGCRNSDMRYYESHKEAKKEEMNQYYINNIDKIKARRQLFYQEHKDEILEQTRLRYKNDIQFRIASSLRRRVRTFLGSGEMCSELLGCSYELLINWFEFNFALYPDHNMTWDNYGSVWHIDHVIPCCSFDMESDNEVQTCFNWKNLAPLPARINQSKNGKRLEEYENNQKLNLEIFIDINTIESIYL